MVDTPGLDVVDEEQKFPLFKRRFIERRFWEEVGKGAGSKGTGRQDIMVRWARILHNKRYMQKHVSFLCTDRKICCIDIYH